MKAAHVIEWGQTPKIVDVPEPAAPDAGEVQIKLLATAVPTLVKGRAAGTHYSANVLPHIPGVDGVGRTSDGKLVYYLTLTPQGGSFQEVINVPQRRIFPVPDGADPVQMAVLANPTMSSWMAITNRTTNLPKDFSVLIIGVTGASGSTAIGVARKLGAGKVIGAARNAAKMEGLGLDGTIELKSEVEQTDFSSAADVDLVIDYLYGPGNAALLQDCKAPKVWYAICPDRQHGRADDRSAVRRF